jgi:bacterial/archaeal transporter family protein
MTWFLIALIAPLLWAISVHMDKFLISRYFKGESVGALMIFSAFIGILLLPIIYFVEPGVLALKLPFILLLISNGILYVVAMLPYYYALKSGEASIVVPLFQLIPFFNYILGLIFLKENLTVMQIIASLLIILGAILISSNNNGKVKRHKSKAFWLMALSAFLFSVSILVFKFVAIQNDFWTASFWEYVGLSISAILLFLFIKSYRKQFFYVFESNKFAVISINGINEVINIAAKMIMNFAGLLAPLALVWVANGFQPFFVLIIGIFLAIFFPKLTDESLNKKYIFQKVIAILIMFVGMYLLNK